MARRTLAPRIEAEDQLFCNAIRERGGVTDWRGMGRFKEDTDKLIQQAKTGPTFRCLEYKLGNTINF